MPRHPVEHVEVAGLRRDRDDLDGSSVMTHGRQLRGRVVVHVPDVVVHHLEVPEPTTGARVEGKDAVGEEVVAVPVAAVEVVLPTAGRYVDDAAGLVDRKLAPVIGATDSGARGVGPRLGAELAGAWDRPERPDERARSHVEGADVAR